MKEKSRLTNKNKTKRKPLPKIYYYEHKPEQILSQQGYTVDAKIPSNGLCPLCHSKLVIDKISIKSDDGNGCYFLHGISCDNCHVLFTRDTVLDSLSRVCKIHFPKGIQHYTSLDKREYLVFEKSIEPFLQNKNIVCVIQTFKGEQYKILKEKDDSLDDNFIYYKNEFGRELLAATIRYEKNKRFRYGEKNGKIRFAKFLTDLDNSLIAEDICIKKGGGYTSGKTRGGDHFVDILFYSPFTKRYESVTVTYNIFDDKYYLDITKWRRFVREFGNPSIKPIFSSTRNYNLSDELRESSILRDYGYSSTLSTPIRRSILTEMVDLDIVSVRKIVDYLKFFLDFHGAKDNMYNSCKAWSDDWDFIENYKVNPERFLIAK